MKCPDCNQEMRLVQAQKKIAVPNRVVCRCGTMIYVGANYPDNKPLRSHLKHPGASQ